MASVLLDTNVIIHFLRHADSPVAARIAACEPVELFVCSIVKAELFYGAAKSNSPEKSRAIQEAFLKPFRSLSFDDQAAGYYAQVRAGLERHGTPIGGNDLMIASIALANDLLLASANLREFRRVEGLLVEDWTSPV